MRDMLAETEEVVRKAKKQGADEVVAKTTFGRYRQVRFSNNQVDTTVVWNDYSTDVVLSWKKRVVMTQIRDFKNVDAAVKKLIALAKVSSENPAFGGFARGKFTYSKNYADKKLEKLQNLSEYVQAAIEAAQKEIGGKAETGGVLFSKFEDVYLASSEGPRGRDSRSSIELSIRAFSQREASGHGVACASTLKNFNPSKAGEKAGEIAKLAKNPKAGKEGVYRVILDPLFSGSIIGTWGGMLSAFSIMTQTSVFVDKLKKRVAPNTVTLKDNPTAYSLSNRAFDDEGVPTKENTLVENGILKSYLHNTSTAKIFKTKTTGNAGLVAPTPWNIEMIEGDMPKEELFEETTRGLYLTNTWYTRFQNYAKGDFSTIPRDGIFLIQNGEVKNSWKDLRLSDNVLTMLGNITAVSKEREQVHWWLFDVDGYPPCLSPYVCIKDVHMTKSK